MAFVLSFVACTKDGEVRPDPFPSETPRRLVQEYLSTSFTLDQFGGIFVEKYRYLFPGYEQLAESLVSTILHKLNVEQIQEFDNPDNAPWHIENHYFTYRSVLTTGDSATLSGQVSYMMFDDSRQRPDFKGFTIFNDKVKLVDNTGNPALEMLVRTLLNQAVVSADIEGFGVQKDCWVPYFDAFTKGRQSIDAAIAAKELLIEKGFKFKPGAKIWNFGISLGGHHSLGVLKYYESEFCPESVRRELPDLETVASICPIDIEKLFIEYIDKDKLRYPYLVLMMVSTIFSVFPQVQSEFSFEDFLSETLNTGMVTVDGVTYTIPQAFKLKLLDVSLLRPVLDKLADCRVSKMFALDMFNADGSLDTLNRKSQLLLQTARYVNLSHDWVPDHKTNMTYSPQDTVVYFNSVKDDLDRFIHDGATILLNESYGTHEFCGLMVLYDFLMNNRFR